MKKLTSPGCDRGLEIIDRYSHLLKSDEKIRASDQQKVDGLVARMGFVLKM